MTRVAKGLDWRRLGPDTTNLIKSLTGGHTPTPSATHTEKFMGRYFTPADYQNVVAKHQAEKAAAKAARGTSGTPGATPAPGVSQVAGGGAAQSAVGGSAPGGAAPGVSQVAGGPGSTSQSGVNVHNYFNQPQPPSKPRTTKVKGDKGDKGDTGLTGATGAMGATGATGAQGKTGAWWPGVLAGLASGTLTAVGVGAWLKSQGASDDVIRSISQQVNSPDFKANQLAARSSKDQMKQQAAAQSFIEANKGNPKFKTAQDFYYAAQAAGMNQSMMNQIAALAKAEGFRDLTRFQD
jgi:hypothetical protein